MRAISYCLLLPEGKAQDFPKSLELRKPRIPLKYLSLAKETPNHMQIAGVKNK
jgi:hypothetical protein